MRKIFLHIPASIIIIFLFAMQNGFSQNAVSVKASINKNKILIGEPIQLTIESTVPSNAEVAWIAEDSISHFDFVQKGKIDSLIKGDQKSFRQDVIITSFDSGTQVLPRLSLSVNGVAYLTDSAIVEVGYSKFDPQKDYHDIKDIVDVENPDAKYIPWIVVAITLISIALVVYFIQKKKRTKEMEKQMAISKLTPYEEAIKSLEELKQQKLTQNNQTKLYYTRLNDILRQFVLRKLQIASMVKTNDELILQLKQLNISNEQFTQLAQALRMSDFVKFAKYLPGEKDNEKNYSIIHSSVELLNKIEK
jgi:uncharacterized protein YehS (DUF1456 family)